MMDTSQHFSVEKIYKGEYYDRDSDGWESNLIFLPLNQMDQSTLNQ